MEKYYSISDAAKLLNVSRPTLYRWIKTGVIHTTKIANFNKISKEEVDRIKNNGWYYGNQRTKMQGTRL